MPVLIENDANLAGLAETRLLRTIPNCSLYVTVSTGIGTGVCTNGYIDPGMRYSEAGRALVEYGGKITRGKALPLDGPLSMPITNLLATSPANAPGRKSLIAFRAAFWPSFR